MKITDRLLTLGTKHGRPGTKMVPQGIIIHYVANPGSSAIGNRNYFENTGVASAHYIIDISGEIIRAIPDNEVAWHAGRSFGAQWDAMSKTNNSRFIGIECCHPDSGGKFSENTRAALIKLCADLCNRYGINQIYRHYDVCGKICPLWYVNHPADWNKLKSDILHRASQNTAGQPTVTQPPSGNKPSDWAADAWNWAKAHGLNDGTRPRDYATREEVAAFIYRAVKHLSIKI